MQYCCSGALTLAVFLFFIFNDMPIADDDDDEIGSRFWCTTVRWLIAGWVPTSCGAYDMVSYPFFFFFLLPAAAAAAFV